MPLLILRNGLLHQLYLAVLLLESAAAVAFARQYYDTGGYNCNGVSQSCRTYGLYRTFQGNETLQKVGGYFNQTGARVSNASGINFTVYESFLPPQGFPLYIPLDCGCSNTTYQMQVQHTIVPGDTYFLLSVTIYGGLTAYQAEERLNPTQDAYNLLPGDVITVPIFCACPTFQQIADGVSFLLTHTVYPGETVEVIGQYYGLTTAQLSQLMDANSISISDPIDVNTTLLVPLASLPPLSTLHLIGSSSPPTNKSKHLGLILGSTCGTFLVLCVLVLGIIYVIQRRRRAQLQIVEAWEKEALAEMAGTPGFISYKHLSAATKHFSDGSKLGEGGFGSVYKGVLPKTGALVAIKKVNSTSRQGEREFLAEVQIISQLRHRNVVELLGFCRDRGKFLLVYELLPKGSLDRALFKPKTPREVLSWSQRWKIVTGTAAALHYLHEEWRWQVIHRDIKPSNIMLDDDFNPKLGDFGLARLVSHEDNAATTNVAGTFGYIAPEAVGGKFTVKTDVFAFGIVALELACGRKGLHLAAENSDDVVLVDLVWRRLEEGDLLRAADQLLCGDFDADQMCKVLKVGLLCSHPNPLSRPSMRQVIQVFAGDVDIPEVPLCKPESVFTSDRPMLSIGDLLRSEASSTSRRTQNAMDGRRLSLDTSALLSSSLELSR